MSSYRTSAQHWSLYLNHHSFDGRVWVRIWAVRILVRQKKCTSCIFNVVNVEHSNTAVLVVKMNPPLIWACSVNEQTSNLLPSLAQAATYVYICRLTGWKVSTQALWILQQTTCRSFMAKFEPNTVGVVYGFPVIRACPMSTSQTSSQHWPPYLYRQLDERPNICCSDALHYISREQCRFFRTANHWCCSIFLVYISRELVLVQRAPVELQPSTGRHIYTSHLTRGHISIYGISDTARDKVQIFMANFEPLTVGQLYLVRVSRVFVLVR